MRRRRTNHTHGAIHTGVPEPVWQLSTNPVPSVGLHGPQSNHVDGFVSSQSEPSSDHPAGGSSVSVKHVGSAAP